MWLFLFLRPSTYQNRFSDASAPLLLRIKVPKSEERTKEERRRYGANASEMGYGWNWKQGGGKKDGMETGGGKGETGKCFVMVLKFDKTWCRVEIWLFNAQWRLWHRQKRNRHARDRAVMFASCRWVEIRFCWILAWKIGCLPILLIFVRLKWNCNYLFVEADCGVCGW